MMSFPLMPNECPETGVYDGIAREGYERAFAWNQSSLKIIGEWSNDVHAIVPGPFKSPAHLYAALHRPPEPTEDQEFGSGYHMLLLEPDLFSKKCVRVDGKIDRRTKEGKETWARLLAEYAEDCILSAETWEKYQGMARAAAAHEKARMLLAARGRYEVACFWRDDKTGAPCKAMLDRVIETPHADYIVDLKTTRCAHPRMFLSDAARYGYHIQAGMYVDGWRSARGVPKNKPVHYRLIAQEKQDPYPVVVYAVGDEWLDAGRTIYRAQLELAESCRKSGKWPGYQAECDFHLADWAMAEAVL